MTQRRVVFGRVNRRYQSSIDQTRFDDEMRMLAALGRFEAVEGDKRWIVGDIEVDESTSFLSGVIGFTDPETRLHFDEIANSWIKALSEEVEGASSKAVVPFAIDLRPDRRWTASVTSPRVHAETFCRGIELALNAARSERGFSTDWEIDLVASPATVEEWIKHHPVIRLIRRTVKLPNPGRDLSDDIREMRNLGAERKTEEYSARRNQNLRAVDDEGRASDAIMDMISGIDTGQVEVYLEARGPRGLVKFRWTSNVDETYVADFADDWQLGIEFVRDALREYSKQRAG